MPPAPAYMNFRRTTSNAAVFDLDVNEAVAQRVEDFKPGQDDVLYGEEIQGILTEHISHNCNRLTCGAFNDF